MERENMKIGPSMATDLWGEPLPEPTPLVEAPKSLPIPDWVAPWLAADLARLPPEQRNHRITQVQREERERERRRQREHERWKRGNPCLSLYGIGPVGAICGNCVYLHTKHYDKIYYKCEQRRDSNSTATDHRKRWPACGRYERRDE